MIILATWVHLRIKESTAKQLIKIRTKENSKRPYTVTNDIVLSEALSLYEEKTKQQKGK